MISRKPKNCFARPALAPVLLLALAAAGCSGDGSGERSDESGLQPLGASNGSPGNGSGSGAARNLTPIDGFGRPAGMAIGTTTEDEPESDGSDPEAPAPPSEPPPPDSDDVEIPTFEPPPAPVIPCSGCVELSAIVDDINQRSQFMFNVGGVQATRVVWTILLPFNSDQLFIRSIVNTSEGPYTSMSANIFPTLNEPIEFVHQFTGTATTMGIAFGSQGAWTGDQRISVFVDSVTIEGSNTTRTFDSDVGGFAATGADRQPLVQFH